MLLAAADPATIISATVAASIVAILSWISQGRQRKEAVAEVKAAASEPRINGALHATMRNLPYPAWIKVVETGRKGATVFRMQFVNRAYEEWFGVDAKDYVGSTDYDIWPKTTADEYYKNDADALTRKGHTRVLESVPESIAQNSKTGHHTGQPMEFEKVYIEKDGVSAIIGFVRNPLIGQKECI